MILESYFNFINETCIRIQGTRVNIEYVLWDYEKGVSPEEICQSYHTLTLEQVYATILYYLANQATVQHYLAEVRRRHQEAEEEWDRNPPEFAIELKKRFEAHRTKLASTQAEEVQDEAALLVR